MCILKSLFWLEGISEGLQSNLFEQGHQGDSIRLLRALLGLAKLQGQRVHNPVWTACFNICLSFWGKADPLLIHFLSTGSCPPSKSHQKEPGLQDHLVGIGRLLLDPSKPIPSVD